MGVPIIISGSLSAIAAAQVTQCYIAGSATLCAPFEAEAKTEVDIDVDVVNNGLQGYTYISDWACASTGPGQQTCGNEYPTQTTSYSLPVTTPIDATGTIVEIASGYSLVGQPSSNAGVPLDGIASWKATADPTIEN